MAKTTNATAPAKQEPVKSKLFSFRIREDLLEKVRALSYWERETITDLVNKALEEAINRHEKKAGPIQPAPEEYLERLQARAGGPGKAAKKMNLKPTKHTTK